MVRIQHARTGISDTESVGIAWRRAVVGERRAGARRLLTSSGFMAAPLAGGERTAGPGAPLRAYLDRVDRDGDRDRIAQRVALEQSRGSRVVGFRRRGREVFLYEEESGELGVFEVGRDGELVRVGLVWTGERLDEWLTENRHYLDLVV